MSRMTQIVRKDMIQDYDHCVASCSCWSWLAGTLRHKSQSGATSIAAATMARWKAASL